MALGPQNAISGSTMTGGAYGLGLSQTSSNTAVNCYIQGATAAFVQASTGAAITLKLPGSLTGRDSA